MNSTVVSEAALLKGRSEAWPGSRLFVSIVALVDCGLIFLWGRSDVSALDAVWAHTLVVLCTLLAGWIIRKDVRSELAVTSLLLLFGPLGGPVVVASRLLSRIVSPLNFVPEVKEVESASASLAEEVFDSIRQGRRYNPGNTRLNSFSMTFSRGDEAAQSAAIAAITRKYSPSMRPALDTALSSRNPALRVQAAAVFAKLRTSYSERATEVLLALQENPRGAIAAALAKEARTVGSSGFIEEELSRHLIAASQLLESRAQFTDARRVQGQATPGQRTDSKSTNAPIRRYSCGGMG